MAKDKSLKSKSKLSKRNKLSSVDCQVVAEELMETKVKRKRKYVEVEEAQLQINSVTESPDEKRKKDKKSKKKKRMGEIMTKKTEHPDPSSCSEGTREPEEDDREQDLSPEEKRVLERKMKKILKKEEKKRLREEGRTALKAEVSLPSASQQAVDYLTCWAENRSAWKFQKTRQTWLLQHLFDCQKIPDDKFSVLLQYLEGLCGQAKDTTVQKALSVIEESGQKPEDTDVQQRAQRAKEVIQLLS